MFGLENFFGDEIEKTVFISEEQLHDLNSEKLYGRYYKDSYIYNIFPKVLEANGDFLCDVKEAGEKPEEEGFSAVRTENGLEF